MSYKKDINAVACLDLPWEKLNGCNILITGATGLIGSCLVEILMSRPNKSYHVYASGRDETRAKERFREFADDPAFHFFYYDVMEPLKSGVDFHYVIHAASNASPKFFASKPVEVMKSNFFGVCNLIDYGIEHNLKRFLFVSTGEIYGEGDGRAFSEDYSGFVNTMLPRSCYPSSKRAAETLCVSYCSEYGIEAVVARPCHIYGPHFSADDNRVYAQFIRNVLAGEDIVMKSSGSQFRSWCYVVDCASALLCILLKGENAQAYNIADEKSNISIKQLADLIAQIGGLKVVIDIPTDAEKAGFNVVSKSVFSTDKIRALGWNVINDLNDNLTNTIRECQRVASSTSITT